VNSNSIPPLKVNSTAKVTNLNADRLDGLDSTDFAPASIEAWHEVGAPGEPGFLPCNATNNWSNLGGGYGTAAFYQDPWGVVHLKGVVTCVGGATTPHVGRIFDLPNGYFPTLGSIHRVVADGETLGRVDIEPVCDTPTPPDAHVRVVFPSGNWTAAYVSLDGITFEGVLQLCIAGEPTAKP
jgi:hypothetical protein